MAFTRQLSVRYSSIPLQIALFCEAVLSIELLEEVFTLTTFVPDISA